MDRLCINCLHFRPSETVRPDATHEYARCAAITETETSLVTGKTKVTMSFCDLSRDLGRMCGPEGKLFVRACDDCGEQPATETWDYSDAPIPNPPAPDHFCEGCAERRRDRAAERAAEDAA